MTTLREILRESDPKLHETLQRNWDIAWDTWLPALGIKHGSYNSYPHLRNHEKYLDDLILKKDAAGKVIMRVRLSPAEIYVLLASVLFHDIGNITKKPKDDYHGKASKETLERDYGILGISSLVLAQCIGRICEYHDPVDPEKARSGLREIVIGSYGLIREVVIASLLTFVDALDSAFTRVIPEYIRSSDEIEIVGAFRRFITGVFVDHESRMVRVSLNKYKSIRVTPVVKYEKSKGIISITIDNGITPIRIGIDLEKCMPDVLQFAIDINNNKVDTNKLIDLLVIFLSDMCDKQVSTSSSVIYEPKKGIVPIIISKDDGELVFDPIKYQPDILGSINKIIKMDKSKPINLLEIFLQENETIKTFTIFQWFLARQIYKIENKRKVENKKDDPLIPVATNDSADMGENNTNWSPQDIAAVIMGDVKHNREELDRIRNDLAAMGIPILAWVIECQEHLFNEWGEETFEPVFSKDFLEVVAKQMWAISTKIFGASLFSYENLAAGVREPDIDKIKRAVHRIAVISRELAENSSYIDDKTKQFAAALQDVIWVGADQWKWHVEQALPLENNKCKCRCISLDAVLTRIGDLKTPYE